MLQHFPLFVPYILCKYKCVSKLKCLLLFKIDEERLRQISRKILYAKELPYGVLTCVGVEEVVCPYYSKLNIDKFFSLSIVDATSYNIIMLQRSVDFWHVLMLLCNLNINQ